MTKTTIHGNITLDNQVSLQTSGLVYVRLRPVIDASKITGTNKPTIVYRGISRGWSLPIYNADNEELFFTEPHVPSRWDGASDLTCIVNGYLDTANDTKRFGLQCDFMTVTPGTDVVGTSSDTTGTVQTLTGTWAQYQSFQANIPLDYDSATSPISTGDVLGMRLIRIAKVGAENEIAGEVIILGISIKYRLNKFYASS